jgi:sorbitol/mannitol transport system permease protein
MAKVAEPTTRESPAAAPGPRRLGPPPLPRRKRWARRLPILPALVFTIVVTQLPFVITLWYSLHTWDFLRPGSFKWGGLTNYTDSFGDQFFRAAVLHTVVITTVTVLVSIALGTGLAVLLDRAFIGRSVVRTLLITPFLIMPVAASLIWRHEFLDANYGFLNWVLHFFGIQSIAFTTRYPLFSVILVLVWQWTPFMMLIILAGLQSQTADVLEAAQVDGANGRQMFRYITLPHLRPFLELCVLLGSIYLVQNFDTVHQLVGGAPDARNVPYFIYQRSIGGGWKFGQASSFGVVVVIATIILATFALRVFLRLLKDQP